MWKNGLSVHFTITGTLCTFEDESENGRWYSFVEPGAMLIQTPKHKPQELTFFSSTLVEASIDDKPKIFASVNFVERVNQKIFELDYPNTGIRAKYADSLCIAYGQAINGQKDETTAQAETQAYKASRASFAFGIDSRMDQLELPGKTFATLEDEKDRVSTQQAE